MIFFLSHSDLHFFDWVVLRRVEQLWFIAYTDKAFEDLSVGAFQLQEMASDCAVGALEVLKNLHLTPFHKEDAIELGLDGVQILEKSLSDLLNLLVIALWNAEEVHPQSVGTDKIDTL